MKMGCVSAPSGSEMAVDDTQGEKAQASPPERLRAAMACSTSRTFGGRAAAWRERWVSGPLVTAGEIDISTPPRCQPCTPTRGGEAAPNMALSRWLAVLCWFLATSPGALTTSFGSPRPEVRPGSIRTRRNGPKSPRRRMAPPRRLAVSSLAQEGSQVTLATEVRASPAEDAYTITFVTAASNWEGVGRFILKKIRSESSEGRGGAVRNAARSSERRGRREK